MTRAKILLLSATCALAVAFGSPAFALNPQPLPPGMKVHISIPTVHTTNVQCASGNHFSK